MVLLPPHAVPIKFIADNYVSIVCAYLYMPSPSTGAPTLDDFYLDPTLEAWAKSEGEDDNGFGWKTYFSRRSFRQGMTQAS